MVQGQAKHSTLTLRNRGERTVIVSRIETSCHCLSGGPVPVQVAANGYASIGIRFDPQAEPDFRGDLSIDLIGKGPKDEILFRSSVLVSVVSADSIESQPAASGE